MCPPAKGFGSAVSRDRWEEPENGEGGREGGTGVPRIFTVESKT